MVIDVIILAVAVIAVTVIAVATYYFFCFICYLHRPASYFLKELRNYNQKYFCVATKRGKSTTNHLSYYFLKENTLWYIKLNTYTEKIIFVSHKQC